MEFPIEALAAFARGEQVTVGLDDELRFLSAFLEQFDSESSKARLEEVVEKGSSGLRCGVKKCVAASDVRSERMLHADAILQVHAMLLAWASAVGVVRAAGKKRGEDAMLHVKHGHVVMDRELKPIARSLLKNREDLGRIEIVGECQSLQATGHENGGCRGIRDIKREVTDEAKWAFRKMRNPADVAD